MTTKAAAKSFLERHGYHPNDRLANMSTGEVNTALAWAIDALNGRWDCYLCKREEEHEDFECSRTMEYQFKMLEHIPLMFRIDKF
jgi:hypothetical protein